MKSLDFDIEERAEQAVRNFEEGYNCAQSVFLAYYDVLGLDFELARNMSVSFGAGVGRMREVCGTVSAMAMLAGFKHPVEDPSDMDARARNYGMVQKMAALFKEQFGRGNLDQSSPFGTNAGVLRETSLWEIYRGGGTYRRTDAEGRIDGRLIIDN